MIDMNEIFSDSDKRLSWWFEGADDTSDLAVMAENVIRENIKMVSVSPKFVPFIWTCLEKANTKIMTRYLFSPTSENTDSEIYDLVKNITSICKKGANGVQIFVKMSDLEKLVNNLIVVRDDLFFEHDLSIGLDIGEIDLCNWDILFQKLREIRANSLVLTLKNDTGNQSDFVGRVYAMLLKWNFDGELHFISNNDYDRIDQIIRLVEILKPDLSEKLRFFLNY